MKTELKRKEMETMKKENIQLKSTQPVVGITKDDDDDEVKEVQRINIYKNYKPLCLIGVVGLRLYMYKSKQVTPMIQQQPMTQRKKLTHLNLIKFNI
jgi:hypothetical protein